MHTTAMKYLLSLLLILAFFGCSTPAGHTVKELGKTVTQCCASLGSLEKKPVSMARGNEESNASQMIAVSIFEIRDQLIRTW